MVIGIGRIGIGDHAAQAILKIVTICHGFSVAASVIGDFAYHGAIIVITIRNCIARVAPRGGGELAVLDIGLGEVVERLRPDEEEIAEQDTQHPMPEFDIGR